MTSRRRCASASAHSLFRRRLPSARRSSHSRSRRSVRVSRSSIWPTQPSGAWRREGRRDAAALARRGAQSRLEGLLADRARAEDELSDAAGRREAAVAALYRLQGGSERLELRGEAAAALLERFRSEVPAESGDPAAGPDDATRLELEAARATEAARSRSEKRVELAERAALVRERVRALEQALAEQEGLPPAARARRARRPSRACLARGPAGNGAGRRRRVALTCVGRARRDPVVGLALLQRASAAGLGSLTVLTGSRRRISSVSFRSWRSMRCSTSAFRR